MRGSLLLNQLFLDISADGTKNLLKKETNNPAISLYLNAHITCKYMCYKYKFMMRVNLTSLILNLSTFFYFHGKKNLIKTIFNYPLMVMLFYLIYIDI